MASKKRLVALALVIAAGAVLTACDEVVSKPADYDEAIVLDQNNSAIDVPNNAMKKVYDQIRNGVLPSDVLNEFLYQYAVSAFGAYNKVVAPESTYTLKDAARDIQGATSNGTINAASLKSGKANEFVKSHKAYWTLNDDGERIHYAANGDATVVDDSEDADELEYARVFEKWSTIEDKIAHTLYSSISGGSYSTRNVFHEKEYVWSLYGNMKNVKDPTGALTTYSGLIRPEVEDYEVFEKQVKDINNNLDTLLHRENYQTKYALSETEDPKATVRYVEDDIIPDIYRTLLTEQYLIDESYPTLGRSYARKVNVVKITGSATYTKGASYLVDAFLDSYIFNKDASTTPVLDSFKTLSRAWTGSFMSDANYASTAEYKLWQKTGLVDQNGEYLKKTSDNKDTFILGTAYGDMMEKFEKIDDNPALSENNSEFTGNNSYVKETGKEIATREIEVKDNTTTGWFIKNGGLNELPDSIRNRLFNISVANAINNENKASHERYDEATKTYDSAKDYNNYIARIHGRSFLKVGSKINNADAKNDIVFTEGNDFYIIEVEEAVSSSKLSRTQAESYLKQDGYGAAKMEEIVNEVVKMVADSDSYRTLAKKYWLEQANLKYHDTVIYNYFKANFPELF